MTRNYIPKKSFFEPTRIQKIAKDLIKECGEDRLRALDTFKFFKDMVEVAPDDDKAKAELNKALQLSMDANDKIVQVLSMMLKMTQAEKASAKAADPNKLSFEDLKNSVRNND